MLPKVPMLLETDKAMSLNQPSLAEAGILCSVPTDLSIQCLKLPQHPTTRTPVRRKHQERGFGSDQGEVYMVPAAPRRYIKKLSITNMWGGAYLIGSKNPRKPFRCANARAHDSRNLSSIRLALWKCFVQNVANATALDPYPSSGSH